MSNLVCYQVFVRATTEWTDEQMPVCSSSALKGWGDKSCVTIKIVCRVLRKMTHAKMEPENRTFFPGLYLHIKKKIYLQRNRGQWSNTSHVLHGSLFLKLLELVLAAHCGLPFHCFLPDEQEVTTDTLPSFFSIVT